MVSADFCYEANKLGCAELAINLIREAPDNAERVKHALNLIKGLVGNDDVKHRLLTVFNVEEDVVIALQKHYSNDFTALAALRCITALALRNPDAAVNIVKLNGAEAMINALNEHGDSKMISRAGNFIIEHLKIKNINVTTVNFV